MYMLILSDTNFVRGGLLLNRTNRINPNGTLNINELTGSKIKNGTSYTLTRLMVIKIPENN